MYFFYAREYNYLSDTTNASDDESPMIFQQHDMEQVQSKSKQ